MRHLIFGLFALWLACPVSAQTVIDFRDELDFDDPEAWAMKFFTSASLQTSLGAIERLEPGAIELGLEAMQIPHLDQEQRTVGFGGFKEEDLNRAPAWGRLRVRFGLPHGFSATLGWVPPAEVNGLEANLLSLAIEKILLERERWSLSLRGYTQVGETKGDLTCEEGGDERFPPGSPENPFGCLAPSSDEITMEYTGLELVGAYKLAGPRAPTLHLGVAGNRLDMEFQVDALVFNFRDRSLLLADGDTFSITGGATWKLKRKIHLGVEAFYSPLSVQRLGQAEEDDSLLHLRGQLRFR
ncbi:MAG: hypothetical protein AAF657_29415, partial [Acidobacteriota bacterium]